MDMSNSDDCDKTKIYATQPVSRCNGPNPDGTSSKMECTPDGKGFQSCMYSDAACGTETQCYPMPPGPQYPAPGKCDNTSIANQSYALHC
jgi:hypothetical protein